VTVGTGLALTLGAVVVGAPVLGVVVGAAVFGVVVVVGGTGVAWLAGEVVLDDEVEPLDGAVMCRANGSLSGPGRAAAA
jgi:hypothetical protein